MVEFIKLTFDADGRDLYVNPKQIRAMMPASHATGTDIYLSQEHGFRVKEPIEEVLSEIGLLRMMKGD